MEAGFGIEKNYGCPPDATSHIVAWSSGWHEGPSNAKIVAVW